ncbi:MAG: hypothetical protein M4579_001151 [Chaenotheca gracillima]|nr:MAG: hypothetical protein M4579_001151 [Chaenotheca gracillima]
MRTRSGVAAPLSPPQKRRRTRSSNAAEESPSKRQNLGLGSEDRLSSAIEVEDEVIHSPTAPVIKEDPVPQDILAEGAPEDAESMRGDTSNIQELQEPEPSVDAPEYDGTPQVMRDSVETHQNAHAHVPQQPEILETAIDASSGQTNGNMAWQPEEDASAGPGGNDYSYQDAVEAPSYQPFTLENWADPSLHLRIQSLPILENLSVQILGTLAKGSHQETLTIVTEPDSAPGQAYATLKSLFDQTKKLYSNHEPFLSAHDLHLQDAEHRNIIRKANLATFVSSIFGSQDVGFYHLNEYFLDTFVPDGARLLKSQGGLYLDLKTQAYLSAMANGERSRREILEDLFPDELDQLLLSRRPGAKQLTPSEIDFVKRSKSRRDHLLNEPDDEAAIAALPDKYVWEDFLRDVSIYVNRNFEDLVKAPASRVGKSRYANHAEAEPTPQYYEQQNINEDRHVGEYAEDAQLRDALQAHMHEGDDNAAIRQGIVEKAARAAQLALQNDNRGAAVSNEDHGTDQTQASTHQNNENDQYQAETQGPSVWQSLGNASEIPYHTQSAPTQVLYERARLAATAKASPSNRRAGAPSQRRPWTTEEENALMAGLDRVKGPHWSQILAMFGAGGTINESLKDRNQVQLKDKARNLKLFFLKSGIEVPYYLQFVTGELKTRAPGQAAKHEAKEKARLRGEEDRAHVQGILALASGARQAGDEVVNSGDVESQPPEEELSLEQRIAQHLGSAQGDRVLADDAAQENSAGPEGSSGAQSQEIAA